MRRDRGTPAGRRSTTAGSPPRMRTSRGRNGTSSVRTDSSSISCHDVAEVKRTVREFEAASRILHSDLPIDLSASVRSPPPHS
jgi:hypothetical protein